MHHATVRWIVGIAIAMFLGPLAAEAGDEEQEAKVRPSLLLTREILEHMDIERPSPEEQDWLSTHFRLAGRGVKYSQPLVLGERVMELNVSGPVMPRKTLGLSFEVKF